MNLQDISNHRISNLKINHSGFDTAKQLVAWMGAMQAQDFLMAKWALGLRIPNATENFVESAYNKGEIIRTHLMRPTWHFVSPDDVYWLLQLTSPRIKPILKSSNLKLELTNVVLNQCYRILENKLSGCQNLNRDELKRIFEKEAIKTDENRLSHIMMNAELDGLISSGPLRNNKLTYSLLEERVPYKKLLPREESLSELAKRYFSSHGPASLQDYVWWSGLSVSNAREGLEMNKSSLFSEQIEDETYWFADFEKKEIQQTGLHLLPAFDEILIAYRNRRAIIDDSINKKAILDNGIFRPIVVLNGLIIGIWSKKTKNNICTVEIQLFSKQRSEVQCDIENEVIKYQKYLNKNVQLIIK